MSTTRPGTASAPQHEHTPFSNLRRDLHGMVILPEDAGYDEASTLR